MSNALPPRRCRVKPRRHDRPAIGLERLERRELLTGYVVTNTGDSGAGSLRQAMLDATSSAGPNAITFAIPGSGVHTIAPASALPVLTTAVTIDGTSQPGFAGTPLIEVDGVNAGATSGIHIKANNCVVQGLVIDDFAQQGINLESGSGDRIRGNYIGTGPTGLAAKPNGSEGIFVGAVSGSTIGGTTAADRNVISGNKAQGIHFLFQTGALDVISGNYIGTDATGEAALGNQGNGVDFFSTITFSTVGGTAAGAGNLISGNQGSGISFFGGGSTDIQIAGNLIGTDAAGAKAIPNQGKGVDDFGNDRITILNNVVSGNTDVGLNLGANNLVAQGNKIGTDISGYLPIGNQNNGIAFGFGGKNATIGGTVAGQGNIIAFNKGKGITIGGSTSQGDRLLGNSIFANTNIGIDLNDDGVTLNGAGSPHAGTNFLQSFPVITSATAGIAPAISGTLASSPSTTYRVEFFASDAPDATGYGQGRYFLGATNVTTDAAGSASFTYFPTTPIASLAVVAATATDPGGNTSEFSAVRLASALSPGFLQFGSASYNVSESGGSATISVTRVGGTYGAASVAYATSNGTATAGSDYTATSGVVSFADGEAGTKTFTVPILDDVVAEPSETVLLQLSSAIGAGLGPVTTATLTIADDDTPGVTVAPATPLVTTEAGGTATFTVRLNTQPTANVSIGLASSNTAEGTVGTSNLVFTPGNWNVPQVVTVTGVDDFVADGDVAYAIVTSAAASADPFYNGLAVPDVGVFNADNDTAGIVIAPTSGLVTTELGGTATFTVRLSSQPTARVVIPVTSTNQAEGTIDRTYVAFDATNWNLPQVVTVTGVADHVADGDVAYSIFTDFAISGDAKYNGLNSPDVSVTNLNADVAGIAVTPTSGLVTTELGGTATFAVRLTSKPTATVTIPLASGDPGEVALGTSGLTFTPSNWNIPQTVLVSGVGDNVVDADKTVAIVTSPAISADPSYSGLNPADVSVVNLNSDVAGVAVAPLGGLVTTEAGGTATFTARLDSRPSANVAVGFASSNPGEGVVATPALVFTPANWSQPQVVTVVGVNDFVADGAVAYTVQAAPTASSDPSYNGLAVPPVGVVNADDDAAGFTVSTTGGLVTTEAGGAATFYLRLNSQPSANVTIPLASTNPSEGVVGASSLVFTPANWNTPQAVTVVGVGDGVDDGNVAYAVATGKALSNDPAYAGLDAPDVGVTNVNIDVAGIIVAPTSPSETTATGGAATFAISLRSRPTAPVAVSVTSSNSSEGVVVTPTLVFTPDNWNVPQRATVVGSGNNANSGRVAYAVVVAATSQDPKYNGINAPSIGLTNLDSAPAAVVGVQVVTVKVKKAKTQAIVVSFNGGLNPATVPNLASYQLVGAGKDKKFGTRDDVRVKIVSATYDPVARAITLVPNKNATLSTSAYQLRVIASGLLDSSNRPVDGNRDGLPGGDAIAIIQKKRATLQ